jgi:protein CLEC16A
MKNNSYIEKHEEQSKEVIQYIIEYLIYGDKHDPNIFDLFCEYNFMNEFIYLSNMNNRTMNLQIIKSFSVLILNMTNTTTLYYIFSNNFINQIISNDYEKYDDEFVSYYVNFIKSLSLKIDTTTVQFFFHKQVNSFPLLQSALKMYNHTDPMIKNVVRNIVLTVLKSNYRDILIFPLFSQIRAYHRLLRQSAQYYIFPFPCL